VNRLGRGFAFGRPVSNKVSQITAIFWCLKVLTTGTGEATSDALVKHLGGPVAVSTGFVFFAVALGFQLSLRRYATWAYWAAVAMVGVFGTMAADVLHVGLGIPYAVSSAIYLIVLAAVFGAWRTSEHTLSIHSITTSRREVFYWAAVLSTFALGTAVGDLTATTLRLGYFGSAALFAGLIAIPGILYWITRSHAIFYFWFAYVLTRPLGASVADWLGMPRHRGGLGLGATTVAILGAVVFVVAVAFVARRERRQSSL
jgi:uncharacterized membrane-anchored protein